MQQSKIPFGSAKRAAAPLTPVDGNKRSAPPSPSAPGPAKRRAAPKVSIAALLSAPQPEASNSLAPTGVLAPSSAADPAPPDFSTPAPATPHWVEMIPRSRWEAALARLVGGYADKSGSGYAPATTNSMGCLLGQKATNRAENGYLQVRPVVPPGASRAKKGEEKKGKDKPYLAHRIAVLLHHPAPNVSKMLAGEHASHLCHQPTCINHNHLVVESKAANEQRKSCNGKIAVVTKVFGRRFRLDPAPCPHQPRCLWPEEEREAVEE